MLTCASGGFVSSSAFGRNVFLKYRLPAVVVLALIATLFTAGVPSADAGAEVSPDSATADDDTSARALAKQSGRRVEIMGRKTETSKTFANPDGTLTLEAHPRRSLCAPAR